MGNAMTAVCDDVSSVWYNPACMSFLNGNYLSFGSVMIYPSMKHKYPGGENEISKVFHTPPYLYSNYKLNDRFSAGFGFNVPFGLQTNWSSDSKTSKIATLSDLIVNNYNLSLSYRLKENISFAVGIDYMYVYRAVLNSKPLSEVKMNADGGNWGYNAAVFYKLNDNFNLGVNYRSYVKIKVKGNVEYVGISKKDAWTYIKFPDVFQIGMSYKYNKWLVSFSGDYTNWTRYRKLDIYSKSVLISSNPKNWKSVWAYRIGGEYSYSDSVKFRSGFFYDKNPVPEKYFETRTPDSDRMAFSLGAGFVKNNITVDLSYTYLIFKERSIDSSVIDDSYSDALNGRYKSYAHMPSIGITYKF